MGPLLSTDLNPQTRRWELCVSRSPTLLNTQWRSTTQYSDSSASWQAAESRTTEFSHQSPGPWILTQHTSPSSSTFCFSGRASCLSFCRVAQCKGIPGNLNNALKHGREPTIIIQGRTHSSDTHRLWVTPRLHFCLNHVGQVIQPLRTSVSLLSKWSWLNKWYQQ